jgi:hypothetical protein
MDRALFDAVQQKLTEQWTTRSKVRNASDYLLAGLLFDDAGHRMVPTHAAKSGVRYRYYVSLPHLQNPKLRLSHRSPSASRHQYRAAARGSSGMEPAVQSAWVEPTTIARKLQNTAVATQPWSGSCAAKAASLPPGLDATGEILGFLLDHSLSRTN